jgi:hypothetical protein
MSEHLNHAMQPSAGDAPSVRAESDEQQLPSSWPSEREPFSWPEPPVPGGEHYPTRPGPEGYPDRSDKGDLPGIERRPPRNHPSNE